jgi:hypothetical protein
MAADVGELGLSASASSAARNCASERYASSRSTFTGRRAASVVANSFQFAVTFASQNFTAESAGSRDGVMIRSGPASRSLQAASLSVVAAAMISSLGWRDIDLT